MVSTRERSGEHRTHSDSCCRYLLVHTVRKFRKLKRTTVAKKSRYTCQKHKKRTQPNEAAHEKRAKARCAWLSINVPFIRWVFADSSPTVTTRHSECGSFSCCFSLTNGILTQGGHAHCQMRQNSICIRNIRYETPISIGSWVNCLLITI